jgi:hypothetical protein
MWKEDCKEIQEKVIGSKGAGRIGLTKWVRIEAEML